MKQPKLSDLVLDEKGTREIRKKMGKSRKIKITINIDQDSLDELREIAGKTGAPYQKLLNQVLRDGLKKRLESESRLDRIERELSKLKKKVAA
ncbi:MAG: BrnA antitoxin family protein [Nitrospirae bacterium]|nr:BrnA antitoxin family protein [Nitrospirota bacterium]